jgi:hypothetical protein
LYGSLLVNSFLIGSELIDSDLRGARIKNVLVSSKCRFKELPKEKKKKFGENVKILEC